MELSVWERIGIQPSKPWYLETGQGMGETLRISDEKGAYTISDRATFIVMEESTSQRILVEGDARLLNQYSVTVVNPSRFPAVNHEGAVAFSEFLRSAATKKLIKEFGWDRYQKRLFYPY